MALKFLLTALLTFVNSVMLNKGVFDDYNAKDTFWAIIGSISIIIADISALWMIWS